MAKILISIDHKWRDLPGCVYAGLLLQRKGHRVYYVRNGLHRWIIPNLRPDLVVLIHLYQMSAQQLVKKLHAQGIKIALMPTEGIPTLEKYRAFAVGQDCDLSAVDLHFVWNEPMAALLSQNSTIDKEKIVVTGVPRFDFYHPPLSHVLQTRTTFAKQYGFDPEFPIVTFATNFTQASFAIQNQDFFLKDAEQLGYKKVLESIAGNVNEIPKRDYESRQICMEAFARLMDDFQKANFILKLHPSEDHQFYQNFINKRLSAKCRQRVRIITQAYIWDILNASDLELKRSCTTGIESWILDKPTVEMKLNPDEWYFSPEHASGSEIAHSYEDLASIVQYYLSDGKVRDELQQARELFLRRWCYLTDGNSTQRMVDHLDVLLRKNGRPIRKIKQSYKNKAIHYGLKIGDNWLHDAKVYGLKNFIQGRYIDRLGREDKYFHQRDVRCWREKLNRFLNNGEET
jgi:surface carbohydrate biosynthesis protein